MLDEWTAERRQASHLGMACAEEQGETTLAERQARLRSAVGAEDATPINEQTLILVAHPDDETLMLGARLERFTNTRLVHVTDGAPRSGFDQRAHGFATLAQYRAARQDELSIMLRLARMEAMPRRCMDIPDQEAALNLPQITRSVGDVLRAFEPEIVITHAYEGGHPDHDACAFAVHAAVRRHRGQSPMIVEGTLYHAGAGGMVTDSFLPCTEVRAECTCVLTERERARKQALLACFATQQETLRQFSVEAERFREAPAYDFAAPPHAGTLLYERFPWGIQAEQFLRLVADAADEVTV